MSSPHNTPSKPRRKPSKLIRQSPSLSEKQLQRIAANEARIAELEKRIADLERDANRQMPPPWTPNGPHPSFPPMLPANPWKDTPWPDAMDGCHVCGNKWKDMTHYVCTNNQCPNRVWCGDSSNGPVFTCNGPSTAKDQLPQY